MLTPATDAGRLIVPSIPYVHAYGPTVMVSGSDELILFVVRVPV